MKSLRSIRVASVFKISLILGAFSGLLYSLMILTLGLFDNQKTTFLVGLSILILGPLMMGIGGAVLNSLMVWVYNRVAERLGGIEVDLE